MCAQCGAATPFGGARKPLCCLHAVVPHLPPAQVEQVLAAMGPGGLPFTTKTAYIVIRGAVDSGRQQLAEQCAAMFQVRVMPPVG